MLVWHSSAWEEYLQWFETDKKKFKRLNQLIKDVMRSPFEGIGKPEPLKENWEGIIRSGFLWLRCFTSPY